MKRRRRRSSRIKGWGWEEAKLSSEVHLSLTMSQALCWAGGPRGNTHLSKVPQANGRTDIRGHWDFGVRLSVMPTKS